MPSAAARSKYVPFFVLSVLSVVATLAIAWSFSDGLFTADGYPIGRDFINYWTGSVAALKGEALRIFHFADYRDIQTGLFGPDLPWHNWSYPPSMLLVVLPLGLMPYLLAYAVWSLAGLALYLWAALRPPYSRLQAGFLALAPASLATIAFGQNGFVTAALFLGGLKTMPTRPIVSGVLFGLLTIKPQLGLLIPLALLAARQWTVIASACVTALLLAGASAALFGMESWSLYVDVTSPVQMKILHEFALSYNMMVTPFTGFRMLGVEVAPAYLLHGLFAIAAAAAVVWAYMRPSPPGLREALLVTCTFIATPYAFNYDMTALTPAIWIALLHADATDQPVTLHYFFLAVLAIPLFCMALGLYGLPLAPLLLSAFALYLTREIALARRGAENRMAVGVRVASPAAMSD